MCPSYLDGDQALLTKRPVIPVGWQPIVAIGCQLAWLCSFQGPRKALRPVWAIGLSKLNSMRPHEQAHRAPGPVDIRYRVELEVDGMPTWPSPALQVLELP